MLTPNLEVSSAVNISDIALLIVDVVEGVCSQVIIFFTIIIHNNNVFIDRSTSPTSRFQSCSSCFGHQQNGSSSCGTENV